MSNQPKEPFEAPVKKSRKKREKVKRERIHIYITVDSIDKIDEKADKFGMDRSPCVQMLLNYALANLKSPNYKWLMPTPTQD
jgi:hypothetical protein